MLYLRNDIADKKKTIFTRTYSGNAESSYTGACLKLQSFE